MKKKVKGHWWLTDCHDIMNDKEKSNKMRSSMLFCLFKILSTKLIDDANYSEHYYIIYISIFH